MKHLKKERREAVGEVKKHETPHGQPWGRAGTTEPDLKSRNNTLSPMFKKIYLVVDEHNNLFIFLCDAEHTTQCLTWTRQALHH